MAARFLFAMPPCRQRTWSDADIQPHTRDAVSKIYTTLADLPFNADAEPQGLPLSARAHALFIEFVNRHGREQSELESDDLKAAWSKLEGYAARFALLFHLVRAVAADPTLVDAERVDESSMAAGIALAGWFGHEARRVYSGICLRGGDRDRQRLIELVRGLGGRATPTDLQRHCRRYRTADQARAALMGLVSDGLGKCTLPAPSPKGGRPSEVFVLMEPLDGQAVEACPAGPGVAETPYSGEPLTVSSTSTPERQEVGHG
jgi:hypothetical protein